MKRLIVATRNPGKASEIAQLLIGLPIEVVSLRLYPSLPEVEETGATFAENALIKAMHAAEHTREMTLADDSGLEVDALGGRPGICSSRFGEPGFTDSDRNRLLLQMMDHVPDEERTARFRCVVAVVSTDGGTHTFDGVCEGRIGREPRGDQGFGYDPLFVLPEYGKTMAEIPADLKNQISHRAKAVRAARLTLKQLAES